MANRCAHRKTPNKMFEQTRQTQFRPSEHPEKTSNNKKLLHIIQKNGNDPEMAKMRNVAGEILGAMEAVYLAQKLGMKKLTIFHDYEGVAAWVLGRWKCKKSETRKYAMVMWKAMDTGLRIYFKHVKGLSGNWGNDEADQLAKLAVGLEAR